MSQKILVVGDFHPSTIDRLKGEFDVVQVSSRDDIMAMSDDQRAEIEGFATFGWGPADVIDALPNLKCISSFGVGYDGVAAQHAADKGVVTCHTPNVLNDDVANTTIMLILATMRRLIAQEAYARSGAWEREGSAPLTHSIAGKTVGIVGLGRIGEAIAHKLSVFNCITVYHSRSKKDVDYPYYADLMEMAQASDVLVVITPGGPATKHLVNRDVIDALGPDGTLVNISRGTVIDEEAMVLALQEGRLGGAGLDVFEAEPKIPDGLKGLDNVTLTPHVGSATYETRQAMGDLVVDNIIGFFKDGKPIAPVPEAKGLL
ncbi:MAG: 2-hydroxyacid dehydrogenase [Ahrensia sp.]|nr:2-hydroxyacid dehydrogenase [Ahrensia sp.]